MIASNSAIKIIFLATLAVASSANKESTSLLRGNGNNGEPEALGRELLEMDMNMGLGRMVCQERIPVDGSVVCQFRVMPPSDLTTDEILHDCLYSSATGSNFCLSSDVNRVRATEVPDYAFFNDPSVSVPPQNPVTPSVLPIGQVGVCPSVPQNSGLACNQYIPAGGSATVCNYGRLRCECSVNDPRVASAWSCFVTPEDPFPPRVPAPVPAPVPVPVPTPQTINVDINQVVVSPTRPPVTTQSGSFNVIINNPESCPDSPSEGAACVYLTRCTYAVENANGGLEGLNCDCNTNSVYQCRRATQPPFSF
jgi:hypothetical protein